jgi:mono/diheme cytochrome c family protein
MRPVLAQRRRPASLLTVAPIWTVLSVGTWADDVDLGREVYDDFCVSCHGRDMVAPGGVTFAQSSLTSSSLILSRSAQVSHG